MVIKASASAEIRLLVEALSSGDHVRRDAAAARLSVIGSRSVDQLLTAYGRASTDEERVIILRVLESMKDARAIATAREALQQGGAVGVAAAHVMHALLAAGDAGARNQALDALVAVALDADAPPDVRSAVLGMLEDLPEDVRGGAAGLPDIGPEPPADPPRETATLVWTAALEGRLPEHAAALREPLREQAPTAPLPSLRRLVETLKARETGDPEHGAEWQALRGTVHHALALRGSRVALYDLRESFSGSRTALPVSFLSAVHAVGDRSCLEPLAQAHAQAPASEEWWRRQLAAAFRAVVMREKLTNRSAVVKKALARWPGLARLVDP
jgi:hypothetical protein